MRESSTYQAILEEGQELGREEGWKKGVAEATANEVEARRNDLLDLLRQRFGAVAPEVEARIRAASDLAKLRAAPRQVFTIASPNDLPL